MKIKKNLHNMVLIGLAVVSVLILSAIMLCADSIVSDDLLLVGGIALGCNTYLGIFILANTPGVDYEA